ncbi:Uncharacterised protein [Bifidobacterium adolescentis]|nr:Uncharacterised protein [Bifidobacterium adolescentis]
MVFPDAKDDALLDKVKPNRSAAASTLARVFGATLPTPRNARETVA